MSNIGVYSTTVRDGICHRYCIGMLNGNYLVRLFSECENQQGKTGKESKGICPPNSLAVGRTSTGAERFLPFPVTSPVSSPSILSRRITLHHIKNTANLHYVSSGLWISTFVRGMENIWFIWLLLCPVINHKGISFSYPLASSCLSVIVIPCPVTHFWHMS